ncbi:MAG TPA: hypothetical protein VF135_03215 [Terriglobales bacterium]
MVQAAYWTIRFLAEVAYQGRPDYRYALNLARISKAELHRQQIDLTAMAKEIASELRARDPQRQVEFRISDHMAVTADPRLMRIAMDNLIGNAWK